jgi:hypothetical protein
VSRGHHPLCSNIGDAPFDPRRSAAQAHMRFIQLRVAAKFTDKSLRYVKSETRTMVM